MKTPILCGFQANFAKMKHSAMRKQQIRKFLGVFSVLSLAIVLSISLGSCSRKSGCPAVDSASNLDKNGNPKVSKTKSNLFSPERRKRMQKN